MASSNLCPLCSLPHPPHHLIRSRSPIHSSVVWLSSFIHGWCPGFFLRAECQSGARNLLTFPVLQSKLQAHTPDPPRTHRGKVRTGKCNSPIHSPQGLIRPRTRASDMTCRARYNYSTPGPNIKNSNTVTAEPEAKHDGLWKQLHRSPPMESGLLGMLWGAVGPVLWRGQGFGNGPRPHPTARIRRRSTGPLSRLSHHRSLLLSQHLSPPGGC